MPFIVRGPGVPTNVTIETPITNVDIAPTLLDLAGAAIPSHMDGISLKSLLIPAATAAAPVARQSVLMSYHGENGPTPAGCAGPAAGAGLYCQWQGNVTTPPFWYGNDFCSCQDATNNTYACMFTVNATANFR